MAARNIAELEREIKKRMRSAMAVASVKMKTDMQEETWGFYSGTTPKMYERTGTLGDSPETTPITQSGNETYFKAYLDTTGSYTSGANPTKMEVFKLANYGEKFLTSRNPDVYARDTKGKKGFWERAEVKMESTFKSIMKSYFG